MLRLFSLIFMLFSMAAGAVDFTPSAEHRVSEPLTIHFEEVDAAQLSSVLGIDERDSQSIVEVLSSQVPELKNEPYQWALITQICLYPRTEITSHLALPDCLG